MNPVKPIKHVIVDEYTHCFWNSELFTHRCYSHILNMKKKEICWRVSFFTLLSGHFRDGNKKSSRCIVSLKVCCVGCVSFLSIITFGWRTHVPWVNFPTNVLEYWSICSRKQLSIFTVSMLMQSPKLGLAV